MCALSQKHTGTVLLADDDQRILRVLRHVLESEGYLVFTVIQGSSAVELVREKNIDVAILHIRMPAMDGISALRQIKSISPRVEVLMMTDLTDMDNFVHAMLSLGAYDYLLKPFGMNELKLRVKSAIQKKTESTDLHTEQKSMQCLDEGTNELSEKTYQLRKSQVIYKEIIENSKDMIAFIQDSSFILANPRMKEITGYTNEQLLQGGIRKLIHPHDLPVVQEVIAKAKKDEITTATKTFRAIKRTGKTMWIEGHFVKTNYEGPAVIALMKDISDRKKLKKALRDSHGENEKALKIRTGQLSEMKQKFQKASVELEKSQVELKKNTMLIKTVFENIFGPLLVMDNNMIIKFVNKKACEYFKIHESAAIGKFCYQIVGEGSEICKNCQVLTAIASSTTLDFERQGTYPGTKERLFVYPIYENDKRNGAILLIRNFTERRTKKRHRENKDKFTSPITAITEFEYGIRHQNDFMFFNLFILKKYLNLIWHIIGSHENLSTVDFKMVGMPIFEYWQDIQKIIRNMENGSDKIQNIAGGFQELSKRKNKHHRQWINVKRMIDKAVSLYKRKTGTKRVKVKTSENMGNAFICLNDLEEILINLLTNANEAANNRDSWITVNAKKDKDKSLVIEIADNGCGMDSEVQQRIFEPFFSTKGGDCTGLGLNISLKLIETMRGKMEIESTLGVGTLVRVVLPIYH